MKRIAISVFAVLLHVVAWAKSTTAQTNAVHEIWPYGVQGIWAFDDDSMAVVQEPFVGAINLMINALVTNIPDAKIGFRCLFSDAPLPDYDAKLVLKRQDGKGNWYYCERFRTEGWLCPVLLKYFSKPPREIFIKAEPLPPELINVWKNKKRKGWFGSQQGAERTSDPGRATE